MSIIKTVSFSDDLKIFEYEQVDLPSPSSECTTFITSPGSVPPPPPSNLPITKQLTALTLPLLPSSDDLEKIMKKLKKPTEQHIVDFRERYELALKRDQEKLNQNNQN
ncbi:predicted protein [Naegleria gruberi]|uniref:Predicted protein n=1 Tax=Naegleria gruberi TaxID=5762 RepID=D2V056_NAEGR|nr:uncharacterized protein NAEGRDRAFT_62176 [Naegleria gruberi]EFC49657.1 predicted protein [Naegleria gruberi]|eukprot:XP_002682401.1 predicted protein [Naegleria gruberi strain NEG-M]